MNTICPRCSTPLVPNDQGICPVCRKPVAEPVDEAVPPGILIQDVQLAPADVPQPRAVVLPATGTPDDILFEHACILLRQKEVTSSRAGLWLILSLGAFVLAGKQNRSAVELAIVVGVLFLHESGHWLGMQLFGYRNVKMFFLPFFGAAVSGKKEGVPQWQEGVVLLLGPLPGLVLGCALCFWNIVSPQPIVGEAAKWLIGINAFNLLPLEPLDGGRLLNLVIFSRHHVLESIFLAITSLLVIGLGLLLSWLLSGLGVLGLLMVPARYRIARLASVIRQRWPVLPPRVADAPEPALRDMFHEVKRSFPANYVTNAAACATSMRSIYERASVRPVEVLGSLALIAAYCVGILLFWVGVAVFAFAHFRPAGPAA